MSSSVAEDLVEQSHTRTELLMNEKNLIFTDETGVTVSVHNRNNYACQQISEGYKIVCIPHQQSSMVGYTIGGMLRSCDVGCVKIVDDALNAAKYVDISEFKVLLYVWDRFAESFRKIMLKFIISQSWFTWKVIRRLQWPTQSPNISLIENLYSEISNRVNVWSFSLTLFKVKKIRRKNPTSERALIESVIAVWHHVITTEEQKLINSLPKRCAFWY